MFTLKIFPRPGSHHVAAMVGALNAAGSVRERDRWIGGYLRDLSSPWADVASRDSCEAFDMVRERAKGCKPRQVKRAMTRIARRDRTAQKRVRGAHWRV